MHFPRLVIELQSSCWRFSFGNLLPLDKDGEGISVMRHMYMRLC